MGDTMRTKRIIWILCRVSMLLLSVIVFTPWVIPKGVYLPQMAGLPYTLWMGMVIYGIFIILIIIGVYVHSQLYSEVEKDA